MWIPGQVSYQDVEYRIVRPDHPEDRSAVQQVIERVSRERTGPILSIACGRPATGQEGSSEFVGAVTTSPNASAQKRLYSKLRRGSPGQLRSQRQLNFLHRSRMKSINLWPPSSQMAMPRFAGSLLIPQISKEYARPSRELSATGEMRVKSFSAFDRFSAA
jgi:hypothetical protein